MSFVYHLTNNPLTAVLKGGDKKAPINPMNTFLTKKYNWMGPGNEIHKNKDGTIKKNWRDRTDEIAKSHDRSYHFAEKHYGKKDPKKARAIERYADHQMVQRLTDHTKPVDFTEKIAKGMGYYGIKAKIKIEDMFGSKPQININDAEHLQDKNILDSLKKGNKRGVRKTGYYRVHKNELIVSPGMVGLPFSMKMNKKSVK